MTKALDDALRAIPDRRPRRARAGDVSKMQYEGQVEMIKRLTQQLASARPSEKESIKGQLAHAKKQLKAMEESYTPGEDDTALAAIPLPRGYSVRRSADGWRALLRDEAFRGSGPFADEASAVSAARKHERRYGAVDAAMAAIPDRRPRRPFALRGGLDATLARTSRGRDDEAHAKNLEQLANQTSQQASQALKEGNRELYEKMMKHVKELLDKAKSARTSDSALDRVSRALAHIPDRRVTGDRLADALRRIPDRRGRARDHWAVAKQYPGGWQLLEGAGTDGGDWMAKGPGTNKRFSSRALAEEHIEASIDD